MPESPEHALKTQHKELYGLLLAANQRLSSVGDQVLWILVLLAAAASVGLHLEWLDEWIGYPLGGLRNLYVYVLIWLAAFALFGLFLDTRKKAVYAQLRPELAGVMRRCGYTQYTLLAEIEGDPGLSLIAERIKQDPDMDRAQARLSV